MNGALAPKSVEDCSISFITPMLSPSSLPRRREPSVCKRPGAPASAGAIASLSFRDRFHVPRRRPHEQLARPADLVIGVADHLVELRDPADGAREREDRRE